jgi:hypothetical protein
MAKKSRFVDQVKESERIAKLPKAKEELEIKGDDNGGRSVVSKSVRLHTIEAVMAHAKIDAKLWKVVRPRINSWECAAYDRDLGWTVQNLFQVRFDLEPVVKPSVASALDALFASSAKHSPKCYKPIKFKRSNDPHMMEIGLYDVHVGKLAWGAETGQSQDLKTIEAVGSNAVEDLIGYARGYDIEQIVMPLGNDFCHVDTIANTTTAGTPVDTDGRIHKVVEVAERMLINAIDLARQVAPVKLLWIPGNHDELVSFFLARTMAAWYRHASDVTHDFGPSYRKYHRYATSLLGFCHGNNEKLDRLPGLMAMETAIDWAETTTKEFHYGHGHRVRKHVTMHDDTIDGVVLRMLPALSATDSWHHKSGFKGSSRAAEAYLYSRQDGYRGHFHASARG